AIIPTPVYLDAGQISLHANYNVDDVSLVGSSNSFWVSPFKLIVTAKSEGNNINGSSHNSETIHKAGQPFKFTVTAVNSRGNVTQNYQPNNNEIELLLTRTGPSEGGFDGYFNYGNGTIFSALGIANPTYQSTTLTAFNAGISTTDSASYSEVGLLYLDLRDVDYGFLGNTIEGDAIDIGRFTPDHFDVSITSNSFEDTCTVVAVGQPDFTYIGQPFSYLNAPELLITAKNTLGIITQNYTEVDYQKLIDSNIDITFPEKDTTQKGTDNNTEMVVSPLVTSGTLTTPASSLGEMKYTFNDSDTFTYDKDANSKTAPFTMVYDIVVNAIQDSDGVNANASLVANVPTSNTVSPTGVNFRFGRAYLANSFGPETANLPQPFFMQFYNLSGKFVTNADDNCSSFDTSNIRLTSGTLDKDLTGVNAATGQVGHGETRGMILTAPGAQGTVKVEYDIYDWLKYDWDWDGVEAKAFNQAPTAVATFGIFRGNDRIIYQREIHN
ncbi:MAG: LamG domain-containing protein, partial [Colwellia sp.]|nr:LamG domain-containing protein [Colwellia sp.]